MQIYIANLTYCSYSKYKITDLKKHCKQDQLTWLKAVYTKTLISVSLYFLPHVHGFLLHCTLGLVWINLWSPEVASSLLNALEVHPEQIWRHFNPNFSESTVEMCVKPVKGFSKSVTSQILVFEERNPSHCNFNIIS